MRTKTTVRIIMALVWGLLTVLLLYWAVTSASA